MPIPKCMPTINQIPNFGIPWMLTTRAAKGVTWTIGWERVWLGCVVFFCVDADGFLLQDMVGNKTRHYNEHQEISRDITMFDG